MTFEELMNLEYMAELKKKLSVVIRVHGEHHPELHEVGELFAVLTDAEANTETKADAAEKMLKVTDGFAVPADACVTYTRVYELLSVYLEDVKKLG